MRTILGGSLNLAVIYGLLWATRSLIKLGDLNVNVSGFFWNRDILEI